MDKIKLNSNLFQYYIKKCIQITIIFLFFLLSFFTYSHFKAYSREIIINLKPEISVFLPIYNKEKYLFRSIKSIQRQTLKNIEIIAVNDFSEDNSLKILIKMKKRDKRIKIINNKKNRGLLYSRAKGILNSKGEYLMNLDPDDELEGPDNLEYLYNIANQSKVDIVQFAFIKELPQVSVKTIMCSNFNNILFQPEIFSSGNNLSDYLITNKLIKKELFLKVYDIFKIKILGEKWNYGEDEIWSGLVNKFANSKICINKAIFIYHYNSDSLNNNKFNMLYMTNLINWLEMFDKIIYDDKKYKKFLTSRISYLIEFIESNKAIINLIKNNIEVKEKYIYIFKNIILNYNINNINITSCKKILQLLETI